MNYTFHSNHTYGTARPLELTPGRINTTLGTIEFRPVHPDADAPLLHSWITHPRSKFWGALEASEQDILDEYRRIAASRFEQAWLLYLNDQPIGLSETYDPRHAVLNDCAAAAPRDGDAGMHILIAPPTGKAIHGLTDTIMSALVRWIFSHPQVRRIVVEPDAANAAIHRKNARVGFAHPGTPATLRYSSEDTADIDNTTAHTTKSALIQHCTRADFLGSQAAPLSFPVPISPWEFGEPSGTTMGVGHLSQVAEFTHRELFAKALREFTHERLLEPRPIHRANSNGNWQDYQVTWGDRVLAFRARPHALLHLSVDPDSIHDPAKPDWTPDIVEGIAEAAEQLGIPTDFRDTYLEEISATFAVRARTAALPRPTIAELADDSRDPVELYQAIESATVTGHPGFLANSGRGGMGETQLRAFSPELGATTDLIWCAVARDHAHLALIQDDADTTSTGKETTASAISKLVPDFAQRCARAGINPANYLPLPVHPWQWEQRLTTTFAADIAAGRIVPLGRGGHAYRPQQSLRTFFDSSIPSAPYVKTAVAVRNMGFTRGLSAYYMASTPRVNAWLLELFDGDPEFAPAGVGFLPEVASIGYTGNVYHRSGGNGPHTKMTATLWRQSPFSPETTPAVAEGDTLSTLAGILHLDDTATPLISAWIDRSGLPADEWVRCLLTLYVRPLLHALIRYGVVFMPHTENVILRLRDGAPVGMYHKDLGEEVAVVSDETPLPKELERLRTSIGSDSDEDLAQQALSIHTDVIDGVLRHLAALLDDHALLAEETFWRLLRGVASDYATDHPELTLGNSREARLWRALLAPTFRHSTLNRLQLRNPLTMVNLGDQDSSLIYAGELDNPLHG